MANRSADEGPVRGRDASERAARMGADEDSPLAPGGSGDQGRGAAPIPPVIPAAAAANVSGDTSGSTAGTQSGTQGSPAAALIAGQIAFGQSDVKTGWEVRGADDVIVGTVAEVGPERVLVDLTSREGLVYIPYSGIASLDKNQVRLAVPSGLVDQQDWQQVRPGGPSGGISPPPSRPSTSGSDTSGSGMSVPQRGGSSAYSTSESEAASHATLPEAAEHAGPVTTGRGVEEGPTTQPIRSNPPTSSSASPIAGSVTRTDTTRRVGGAPMPPQFSEGVEPMQRAQDMIGNVRNTVQGATQGQMSQSTPKDAFADMFSFLENIPNSFYYLATVVSVMTSLVLFVSGKRWESLFVGLWAPTIVSASMFYKLLRPSHEVRQM